MHDAPSPRRHEGTKRDRHGTLARVAMDAAASGGFIPAGRKRSRRTAKSCGPGAATLASIPAGLCWRGNGDNKGRSPGRVRISRKPLARGKPGCPGCTCQTRVHSIATFAHGAAGAVGARLSLRPLPERGPTNLQDSSEKRAAGMRTCVSRRSGAARKSRTRNLEIPRCAIAHLRFVLRTPRNDSGWAV
jgi:hypothetical protein